MSIREEIKVGAISQISTHYQGDALTGLGQRPRSQTVTTFYSRDDIKLLKRKNNSIAVELWTRQLVLLHGHKNLLIDYGGDLLSNDLLLSSSALLF